MNGLRRRGTWVVAGLALVSIGAAVAAADDAARPPASAPPHRDVQAPGFELPTARGGTLRLVDLASHVVLLAFMNLHALADAAGDEPSVRQIGELKFLQGRYGARGVRTVIVDASALVVGPQHTMYRGESDQETIPVVRDDAAGSTVARYGVTHLPTTVLIAASGRIVQRWEGVVTTRQLEDAVQLQLPQSLEAAR